MTKRLLRALSAALAVAGCVTAPPIGIVPRSGMATGVAQVPLHYLDFGGRGEPVVLLAGAGNTAWIYGDFGRRLARDHRTFALTRRGHGAGSGSPASGYSIDIMVEDLRQFLDQRGLKRVILIGHSLAGAELTAFAAKYPGRVSALIYLDAAYDRSIQGEAMAKDPVEPEAPSAADRASIDAFAAYVRRTRPDLKRYWTADVERDLRASLVVRPDSTAGWVTAPMFGEYWTSAASAPPNYGAVRVPALAIYSVEDEQYRLAPGATNEQRTAMHEFERGPLAKWRQQSIAQFGAQPGREVRVMDAGHHLFLHRPDETLALIHAFLRKHRLQ